MFSEGSSFHEYDKGRSEQHFQTAFTLETSGMVEISVDKAGGGDPLLAWMGIVKDTESEDSGTQTEVVEIGSDVWPTSVIPAIPKEQAGVEQSEISLNETTGDGTWKYLYDIPDYTEEGGVPYPTAAEQDFDFRKWENKNWQNIKIPGEALMQGFDILTNNEYYYQREISIPEDFADRQILIRFDGVYCNARVWIDGTYIRTHVGWFYHMGLRHYGVCTAGRYRDSDGGSSRFIFKDERNLEPGRGVCKQSVKCYGVCTSQYRRH